MGNSPLNLLGKLPPLPGMTATSNEEFPSSAEFPLLAENLLNPQPGSASAACPSRDLLGQCQPSASQPSSNGSSAKRSIIGSEVGNLLGVSAKLWEKLIDPIFWVTFILGFLLVAAGLFSHPAVREKIAAAGKVAGKAAALAA